MNLARWIWGKKEENLGTERGKKKRYSRPGYSLDLSERGLQSSQPTSESGIVEKGGNGAAIPPYPRADPFKPAQILLSRRIIIESWKDLCSFSFRDKNRLLWIGWNRGRSLVEWDLFAISIPETVKDRRRVCPP